MTPKRYEQRAAGVKLWQLRLRLNLSESDAAGLCGQPIATITRAERGQARSDEVAAISTALLGAQTARMTPEPAP